MAYASVSIFAANINQIHTELEKVRESGAEFLHFDVMDGKFVPLQGLDVSLIEAIRSRVSIPVDVHLMVCDVEGMIQAFEQAGVHSIVFHVEGRSAETIHLALKSIRRQGIKCGLAISPDTDIGLLAAHFENVDEILVMTTYPGCSDAVFLESSYDRIRRIRKMVDEQGGGIVLSVDGGVDEMFAHKCIREGADKIVIGRAFFSSDHPLKLVSGINGVGN
jgi:ribulose-phosphate 3-epimerase